MISFLQKKKNMMNKYSTVVMMLMAVLTKGQEDTTVACLRGTEFLHGIQTIIGADPHVSSEEVRYKPFVGSFSTIQTEQDETLFNTSYCMTDNACGHWDAYSRPDVALSDLSCNSFCYIPTTEIRFVKSSLYSPSNPPPSYLNCGWETCG